MAFASMASNKGPKYPAPRETGNDKSSLVSNSGESRSSSTKTQPQASKSNKSSSKTRTSSRKNGKVSVGVKIPIGFKFTAPKDDPVNKLGFSVEAQDVPTTYSGGYDDTLFQDFNVNPTLPQTGKGGTNEINMIVHTANFTKQGLTSTFTNFCDVDSEFNKIYEQMLSSVIQNSNGAAGSMNLFTKDNVIEYLFGVGFAYDMLIQLETLSAWNPKDVDQSNSTAREIALLFQNIDVLEQRNILREELSSMVLPIEMINFIRFMREYKLRTPEGTSLKSVLVSTQIQYIINLFVTNKDSDAMSSLRTLVEDARTFLRRLPSGMSALILRKTDPCFGMVPINEHLSKPVNCPGYDKSYNDLVNNLPYYGRSGEKTVHYPAEYGDDDNVQVALCETAAVSDLALASLTNQFHKGRNNFPFYTFIDAGLTVTDQSTTSNRSYYYYTSTNDLAVRFNERWYEHVGDNYHTADFTNPIDITTMNGISTPKGNAIHMVYAGRRNIGLASRRLFATLFSQ